MIEGRVSNRREATIGGKDATKSTEIEGTMLENTCSDTKNGNNNSRNIMGTWLNRIDKINECYKE